MTVTLLPPLLAMVFSLLITIVTLVRGRRSPAEWLFAGGMLLLGAESACVGMTLRSTTSADVVRWQMWTHGVKALLPITWLAFSMTFARGDTRTLITRQRVLVLAGFFIAAIVALGFPRNFVRALDATEAIGALGWSGLVVHGSILLGGILTLVDLERTFRTAVGTTRWRIKYLLFGLAVLFVTRIYTSCQALLYKAVDLDLIELEPTALVIGQCLIFRSLMRPGLFTADLYPSQSFLRGSITIVVAGAYLLVVGVLARLATLVGATAGFPLQAFVVLVSLVMLAIVLQSDHARMRLRRFVSRHFHRSHVDFQTTWRRFATLATTAGDTPELCRNVVKLVAETFEVLSVTVWLLNDGRNTLELAASSFVPSGKATPAPREALVVADLIQHFRSDADPVDLETVATGWTRTLKRWHPQEFPTGGHRVCVPLIARGELLGLITLGDRVGGEVFSAADLDVFKCVGDHVAASLLNAQLAQRLLLIKEVESFQLMATFFVHDLKNAANTLNLLLRNLPEHFHDREFREDALRGCAKTVAHINALVGRLSELRQELRVSPQATDVTEFIRRVLGDFPTPPGITVIHDLVELPSLPIDPEQMRKVLTNFLHNAREAISENGTLHIATGREHDRAFFAVTDTGCGMSAEFIQKSLFRPFQTTKPRGLGIGMFHSKMIVEAHGGRIEVNSALGKGTTFRVMLPCPTSLA